MAEERKIGVSFSFSKRKPASKSYNSEKNALSTDGDTRKDDEKDYIHSAEGKELKSVKQEEKAKEKVIPCQTKNRWILPPDAKFSSSLDRQAVEELMKASSEGDKEGNKNENVSIPLLMRNALPDIEGFEKNEKLDIAMRPEQSSMDDYEDMPVTSFGAAMLRGMGWKKGEAIGGTNKGLAEPIEYIPRSKGLGLGAVRRPPAGENGRLGKKPKPGDTTSNNMTSPIQEEGGRVRHYKGVGEQVQKETSLDYRPGVGVIIEKGPHKNIFGKIVAVDIDTSRITVQLHLSKENVAIHQFNTRLLDDFEYKTFLSRKDNAKENAGRTEKEQVGHKKLRDGENHTREEYHEGSKYSKRDKGSSKSKSVNSNDYHGKKVKCWLFPQTRVRIISKDYKKGKYYNKKVQIIDVVSTDSCVCQTDEGRLLEDVPQSALETVVPKTRDSHIRVVQGDHRGQLAVLLERDTSKYSAVIQLMLDKNIVTVDYDDICEHIGEANEY